MSAELLRCLARFADDPPELAVALPGDPGDPGDPPLAQARLMLLAAGRHSIAIIGPDGPAEVELTPHQGLFLSPRAWLRRRHATPYHLFGVVFHRTFTRLLLNRHRRGATPQPAQTWLHLHGPPAAPGRQLVGALAAAAGAGGRCRRRLLGALLESLHGQTAAQPSASADDPLYRAVIDHLAEHLAEPIGRDQVAHRFTVHPNHLSRVFARHGTTFIGSLIDLRLARADELLPDRRLGLAAIAAACGYGSAQHFANEYRRRRGISPGRARA